MLLDYVSGIEYRDEALNSVFHAEGRAFKDKDKDKWQYEYFIKDPPAVRSITAQLIVVCNDDALSKARS